MLASRASVSVTITTVCRGARVVGAMAGASIGSLYEGGNPIGKLVLKTTMDGAVGAYNQRDSYELAPSTQKSMHGTG